MGSMNEKHVPGEKEIRARYFHFNLSSHHQELALSTDSSQQQPNGATYHMTGLTHHDESKQGEEALDRVFLWHKDTDPFSRDERIQSAGYYDSVKVISSTNRGCIDRIFDMRHDPLEKVNLLTGNESPLKGNCKLHFQNVDLAMLKNVLANVPVKPHCRTIGVDNKKHNNNNNNNISGRDLISEEDCKRRYNSLIATKVWIILKKLIPFVRYGNRGHLQYLEKDANHATCMIPTASEVVKLNYYAAQDCKNDKYGCSAPEY
jgi:hypothetical protein